MKAAFDFEPAIREITRDEITKFIEELKQKSEYVTLPEAKETYHLFGAKLYRLINARQLNLYHMGERSFLKRSEVEALIIKGPPRPVRHDPRKGQPKKRNHVAQNTGGSISGGLTPRDKNQCIT